MSTLTAPALRPANVAPNPTESPWTLEVLGSPAVAFAVYGTPGPQGSKKVVGRYKKGPREGQAILAESSKKVKPWRDAVEAIAKDAAAMLDGPLDGPLVVDMIFTFQKPKTFPAGDLRRSHGMHTVYPDLSKLARSTEDALTSGDVWADDSRVVAYRRLEKCYVGAYDPDALRAPGAVVRVWPVPAALIAERHALLTTRRGVQ